MTVMEDDAQNELTAQEVLESPEIRGELDNGNLVVLKGSDGASIEKRDRIAIASAPHDIEDNLLYRTVLGRTGQQALVEPPYDFVNLSDRTRLNNTLLQCIEAMITNIDGTGYEFVRNDLEPLGDADAPSVALLEDFFEEPYPGTSFMSLRKRVRRDKEETGNGYLEVVRNAGGMPALLRHVDARTVLITRLGEEARETATVHRISGAVDTVTLMRRRRRYVQLAGTQDVTYYKEYGDFRTLNRRTGEFGVNVPVQDRATELLHFTAIKDVRTAYGVPRWINNAPAAVGSRKAEEMNVEYFANGGVPPVIMIVQGGSLSRESSEVLTKYLSQPAAKKQRMLILEADATGGSLDSAGSVRTTIERFGSEKQQDALFMGYDKRTEERVRGSFRLPGILLGLSDGYNYATAAVAYMATESQVFEPERREFDEIISKSIVRELVPGYRMRSRAVHLRDVNMALRALNLTKDSSEYESWLGSMNEVAGLDLRKMDKGELDIVRGLVQPEGAYNEAEGVRSKDRKARSPSDPPQDK